MRGNLIMSKKLIRTLITMSAYSYTWHTAIDHIAAPYIVRAPAGARASQVSHICKTNHIFMQEEVAEMHPQTA